MIIAPKLRCRVDSVATTVIKRRKRLVAREAQGAAAGSQRKLFRVPLHAIVACIWGIFC